MYICTGILCVCVDPPSHPATQPPSHPADWLHVLSISLGAAPVARRCGVRQVAGLLDLGGHESTLEAVARHDLEKCTSKGI